MAQARSEKDLQARRKIVQEYLKNFANNSAALPTVISNGVLERYNGIVRSQGKDPTKDTSPYYFNGTQVLLVGPICENPRYAGHYNFMKLNLDEIGPDVDVFIGQKARELSVDCEDMVFLEDLIEYTKN